MNARTILLTFSRFPPYFEYFCNFDCLLFSTGKKIKVYLNLFGMTSLSCDLCIWLLNFKTVVIWGEKKWKTNDNYKY